MLSRAVVAPEQEWESRASDCDGATARAYVGVTERTDAESEESERRGAGSVSTERLASD